MGNMSKLDRLETLAQRLIEGTFNRLCKAQASPPRPPPPQKEAVDTREALRLGLPNTAARWLLQGVEQRLRLGEPVVRIGRALDNDLVLNDPTVSRYHAQLRWRDGRYHICPADLSKDWQLKGKGERTLQVSKGSTRISVNQQGVIQSPLAPGDVIQLGRTVLTIVVDKPGSQ